MRNVITRSLGSDPAPSPDVWVLPPTPGERFIVCSDGLSNELTTARSCSSPASTTTRRSRPTSWSPPAAWGWGRDNVSVVVVAVDAGAGDGEDDADTAPRTGIPHP